MDYFIVAKFSRFCLKNMRINICVFLFFAVVCPCENYICKINVLQNDLSMHLVGHFHGLKYGLGRPIVVSPSSHIEQRYISCAGFNWQCNGIVFFLPKNNHFLVQFI